MTTLADLTPEERANCVGMWCDYRPAVGTKGPHSAPEEVITTVILKAGNDYDAAYEDEYEVFNAAIGHELVQPEQITLRPDIPRAWQADGTPPAGEWQTGKVKIIPNGNAKYDPALNVITGDAVVDPDHEPREAHDIRRWIGEWEEA